MVKWYYLDYMRGLSKSEIRVDSPASRGDDVCAFTTSAAFKSPPAFLKYTSIHHECFRKPTTKTPANNHRPHRRNRLDPRHKNPHHPPPPKRGNPPDNQQMGGGHNQIRNRLHSRQRPRISRPRLQRARHGGADIQRVVPR